jgi:F-type H+-transporting ATPase subunit a
VGNAAKCEDVVVIHLLLAEGPNPLTHVVQHRVLSWDLSGAWPFDHFTLLSNHVLMQILAAALIVYFLPRFVKQRAGTDAIGRQVPTRFGNALEFICEFLRVHVARPALGQYTDLFMPYLWSAFFFILTCNLLGLIPLADWTKFVPRHAVGGTSTGNIMVTAALALSTLGMIVVNGLRLHGFAYVKHFFIGPPGLNAFIAVLEVIGLLAKTFALAMRLFANMLAGHILLAVLLSFIGMAWSGLGTTGGILIAIPVVAGSVAINFLELLVAFLQAFIFTFLSATFIGQAVNIHHDHEHAAEHEHGQVGQQEHGTPQVSAHGA